MVRIRLSRSGAKKRPFYYFTVADSRRARNGGFIERIGFYNPLAAENEEGLKVNLDRFDYWLSVGGQPSERVKRLIKQVSQASSVVEEAQEAETAAPEEAEKPEAQAKKPEKPEAQAAADTKAEKPKARTKKPDAGKATAKTTRAKSSSASEAAKTKKPVKAGKAASGDDQDSNQTSA